MVCVAECNIMGQISTVTGCETAKTGVLFPDAPFFQSVLNFDANGDTRSDYSMQRRFEFALSAD